MKTVKHSDHSDLRLPELQTLFWQAILQPVMHSDSVDQTNLKGLVDSDAMAIYQDTVQTAHVEALKTSYPKIYALLGEQVFKGLARGYFINYPPTEPNLIAYGGRFPEWLKQAKNDVLPITQLFQKIDLSLLAQFEWAFEQGYYSEDKQFSEKDLQVLSNTEPQNIRFKIHPAIKLFYFNSNLVSVIEAELVNVVTTLKKQNPIKVSPPYLKPVVVFRDGWKMEWLKLSREEAAILQGVQNGSRWNTLSQLDGYEERVLEEWLKLGWIVQIEQIL